MDDLPHPPSPQMVIEIRFVGSAILRCEGGCVFEVGR